MATNYTYGFVGHFFEKEDKVRLDGAIHAVILDSDGYIIKSTCGNLPNLKSFKKISIEAEPFKNWLKYKAGSLEKFDYKTIKLTRGIDLHTAKISTKDINTLLNREQCIKLKLELTFLADRYGEKICGSCCGFENF